MPNIRLELIDPSSENPRFITDEKIDRLTNSIREYGLREPISVRPKENGRYEIIDGECRWKAYTRHNIDDEIPAITKELTEEEADKERFVVNRDRESYSWAEEWRGIKMLAAKYNKRNYEVAAEQNVSEGTVSKHFQVVDKLSPNLLPKLVKGKSGVRASEIGNITADVAYNLVMKTADIEDEDERYTKQQLYADTILEHKLTNEGAQEFIRRVSSDEIEEVTRESVSPISLEFLANDCLREIAAKIIECSSEDCSSCAYFKDCRSIVRKAVKAHVLETVPELIYFPSS